jgi:hypothetical protein
MQVYRNILTKEPEYHPDWTEDFVDLLRKLLTKDPKRRLGCVSTPTSWHLHQGLQRVTPLATTSRVFCAACCCCSQSAACCPLLTRLPTHCLLLTDRWLLPSTRWLLVAGCWLLVVSLCSLVAGCCVFAACWLLVAGCCDLLESLHPTH